MITDSLSDMLTRIRNANLVRHQFAQISYTKMNLAVAQILKEEGYIIDYEQITDNNMNYLLLYLKYKNNYKEPIITTIKRASKPGLRIYVGKKNIPVVLGNLVIAILSTSSGVMTNNKARQLGIGGEVLCYIW
jgi:small subunit ribosomal protein S8